MKALPIVLLSLFLLSCSHDPSERAKLFPPEVTLGSTRAQLDPVLKGRYRYEAGTAVVEMPDGPARMILGFRQDTLQAINLFYRMRSARIDDSSRMTFKRVSDRAFDHLGMPDDWIQRETISGQRAVWYYEEDSTVIDLVQKQTGDVELSMTRSGQRFRDVMYEMNNFLTAPQ